MRWFLFTLTFLFLLVLSLPTLLSTPPGTSLILSLINHRLPGHLSLTSLDLSWLGSQSISGIDLRDADDAPILTADSLTTTRSLLSLITRGPGGEAVATRPSLTLHLDPSGLAALPETGPAHLLAFPLLSGSIQIIDGALHVMTPDGATSSLTNLNLTLNVPSRDQLSATLTADASHNSHSTPIEGSLLATPSDFRAHLSAPSLPTPLLDALLSQPLSQILGPTLSLTLDSSSAGDAYAVALDARSPLSSLTLRGQVQDNALTLTSPLRASLQVTPALGAAFLSRLNLFFRGTLRSEEPITLTIDPSDFLLPFPPSLQTAHIPQITITPGTLYAQNRSPLSTLLSLFPEAPRTPEVRLITTPLYLSLRHSQLTYHRMDMLIGPLLHLASWGTADLTRNTLDMSFAIPAPSLSHLLGTPVSSHFLITASGPLTDPRIRWDRLASQLARLLISPTSEPLPPPTTQPFPWPSPSPPPPKFLQDKAIQELRRKIRKL